MSIKTDIELYFHYKCWKGLKQRDLFHLEEYRKQLQYEIEVITSMKFCEYFLIVADFINWAKNNKILIGYSRGSVGGSLCAYCLQITQIDPIKYNLYFERFLNPQKISIPDIDVDICEENRDKVVEYVKRKYGEDKIANIGTFGTMLAKAAIRDVTRTLGYDYSLGDKIAKLILEPIAGKPQSLQTCYEKVPELNDYRNGLDCPEKEILIWAEKLENRIKSQGCHASGVLIAKDNINKTVPTYKNRDNQPTTQFEMKNVEECGLVKFDFLGLRTLTTIRKCLDIIERDHDIEINIYNIPDDDKNVFKLLQSGDTEGLFQVDGQGMRDLLVNIIPKNIEDISAVLAIFRPGPLGSINFPKYFNIRRGLDTPEYIVPELKLILEETAGNYVYQEQIMAICRQLAGYTLPESDLMRKAIGKKKEKELLEHKDKFISGMIKNGFEKKSANKIFEDIESFASYGFCKCISGKTKIYRGSSNQYGNEITIEHLYKVKNNPEYCKKYNKKPLRDKIQTYGYGEILALDSDNRIRPRKIKDIYYNGIKSVYKIIMENGIECVATKDHKFLSIKGYLPIEKIEIGTKLIIDGGFEFPDYSKLNRFSEKDYTWKKRKYLKKQKGFGTGENNPAYTNGEDKKFKTIKNTLINIVNCQNCGIESKLEYHHQDGNKLNNHIENIVKLCQSCHKKADYKIGKRKKKWTKGHKIDTSKIISIKYIGEEETYDIEMDTIEHNFIANGLVSSNSHSIGYAYITYCTAYLKTYYPLEFICACLITNSDNPDKIIKHISYCRDKKIKILGPDINKSEYDFTIDRQENAIRFGLGAIKNLGQPVKDIIKERDKNGKFIDIIDFSNRVDLNKINKRKIESLIYGGAFDQCGNLNRISLINQLNNILQNKNEQKRYETKLETYNKKIEIYRERELSIQEWEKLTKEEKRGKKKPTKIKLPEKPEEPTLIETTLIDEFTMDEKLSKERELIGYYISGHPLDEFFTEETKKIRAGTKTIEQILELNTINKKERFTILAIPSLIKKLTTKKNKNTMAYAILEDKTGRIEATIFPKTFSEYENYLNEKISAKYSAKVELVEVNDISIKKLMIEKIEPLKKETQKIEIIIPIDKAKEVCQIIKYNSGNNYLANIKIISDNYIYIIENIKTNLSPTKINNLISR